MMYLVHLTELGLRDFSCGVGVGCVSVIGGRDELGDNMEQFVADIGGAAICLKKGCLCTRVS